MNAHAKPPVPDPDDYHAQIDWTEVRKTPRAVVDAELIRFAEEHRRKTGKTIYPLSTETRTMKEAA
jgi:hypothetical protein